MALFVSLGLFNWWSSELQLGFGFTGGLRKRKFSDLTQFQPPLIQQTQPPDTIASGISDVEGPQIDVKQSVNAKLSVDKVVINGSEDSKAANGSEDSKTATDDLFLAIAEEKRSRKATKSDDAAIPMHLWMECLCNGNTFGWSQQVLMKLDWAIPIIQGFLLRVWKRRLTQSFVKYLKHSVLKDSRPHPKGVIFDSSHKYQWSSDGADRYRIWWTSRWVKG